jgi:uncharacterized membrane protein YeaQ/YmgE (transglycosylase-associated protein family)
LIIAIRTGFAFSQKRIRRINVPLYTLIIWLIVGGVIGFIAPRLLGGPAPGGRIGDFVMAIVGALLGGYGTAMMLPAGLQGAIGGLLATIVAAVAGALLLSWIVRQFKPAA